MIMGDMSIVKIKKYVKQFAESYPEIFGFMQDIVYSLAVVAVIASVLYIYAGIWPPMVSVTGMSMYPNMENGDLVFIQGLNRGDVKTYEEAVGSGYMTYNDYGDIIVYKPYGDASKPLVIHRAIRIVNASEPMWQNGPPAPYSGYITLGDNNNGRYDQDSPICSDSPVKDEWILGIARFKLPYLGYLRLAL